MSIVQFCVNRKVTVAMSVVTVIVFGVISWFSLDQEYMPELQFPQLTILTHYSNASSQEIENLVTKVIEEAAGTVKNARQIHSISREGISIVTVEFNWGTHMDLASLNLREKVDLVKAKLPRESGEPRIEKFNPFALPVVTLSLSGKLSEKQLLDVARRPIAELLEKLSGVAAVQLVGGREREIQVEVDAAQLTARGLTLTDVGQSIARSNLTYPAGTVKNDLFDLLVRVEGYFVSPSDLSNIAVSLDRANITSSANAQKYFELKRTALYSGKKIPQPITLGTIATVQDGLAENTSYSRLDQSANVSISVLKQADSNIVKVARAIKKRLPEIQSKLPEGVQLQLIYDQSIFIRAGINSMLWDSLLGGLLAFIVLLVFLRSWRDSLIVSVSIPFSILVTLFMMELKGMTLNTVTLAGLAIGIGMLVDAAIVVQENIARHKEFQPNIQEAAIQGTQEVVGAVGGSIATTIAVFFPLIFVTGIMGQLFKDFSWVVVFSQLASLVVAFTVIPLLSVVFSRKHEKIERLTEKEYQLRKQKIKNEFLVFNWKFWKINKIDLRKNFNFIFLTDFKFLNEYFFRLEEKLLDYYEGKIRFALDHPKKIFKTIGVLLGVSLVVLFFMPKTVFPELESDEILVRLNMPVGTPLEKTNERTKELESLFSRVPEIKHMSVTVGSLLQEGLQPLSSYQAKLLLRLDEDRKLSSKKCVEKLKKILEGAHWTYGSVFFHEQGGSFSFLGDSLSSPILVEIKGHHLSNMEKIAVQLKDELGKIKGVYNVRTSMSDPSPELQLNVKRAELSHFSLSVAELAEEILMALRGKVVSKFHELGKEIDIRVRLRPEDRKNTDSIKKLYVHSPLDLDVPLNAVVDVQEGWGPSEILRYGQQRTILVSADFSGRSLDSVFKKIEGLFKTHRTSEISLYLTGEKSKIADSFHSLIIVLILSILFVYMLMAAQFENLWQPLLILITIPLAIIGMPWGLLLRWEPLSAPAAMGLVFLGGIVVNNGIVLIDFINQEGVHHSDLRTSLIDAGRLRLRPILMTALTSVLGMIPLALGIGEGSEAQAPMAIVVVSGLFVSTLLTLIVLPSLYFIVANKIKSK